MRRVPYPQSLPTPTAALGDLDPCDRPRPDTISPSCPQKGEHMNSKIAWVTWSEKYQTYRFETAAQYAARQEQALRDDADGWEGE